MARMSEFRPFIGIHSRHSSMGGIRVEKAIIIPKNQHRLEIVKDVILGFTRNNSAQCGKWDMKNES